MGDGPAQGRIQWDILGDTAWITIDNPRKRNAMDAHMWRQVPEALTAIEADERVRVVVLAGAGGTFCAGADISDLQAIGPTVTDDPGQNLPVRAETALLDCPLPTIALIEGHCVGGGCQLAAACDIRIATPSARFGITPAKLGLVYPPSSIQRLVEIVGPSAAKLLLFSGEILDAERAHHMRLVDEITEDAHARVASLAATMASRSALSVAASKELVDMARRGEGLDGRARHWQRLAATSGEAAEGVRAFLERRAPTFPYRHDGRPPTPERTAAG
ncbi:Enoyl-CoA hydratase/carnithine racemase [Marinactinospora thermotolerans DSM 45154]|uniref:Enoyl-CoA hydratase/carnithine racemase n=2 Tax=Marinactinospora thermotolerans TaxID=531310 RepID=A0A1T4K1L1_9ACTN|nr:Enoyl-CoA hydratase/carnithine racemase [Marinactinospora thermotolerans DSM 45154]